NVAASPPTVPPDAPSLWPVLERRIEAHHACARDRWFRAVQGVADWGLSRWVALDDDRPLRLAWLRDSLSVAIGIDEPGGGRSEHPAGRPGPLREFGRRPGLVLGLNVAAAGLAVVVGLSAARRQLADAQSTIRTNAMPLAGRVGPTARPEENPPATSES